MCFGKYFARFVWKVKLNKYIFDINVRRFVVAQLNPFSIYALSNCTVHSKLKGGFAFQGNRNSLFINYPRSCIYNNLPVINLVGLKVYYYTDIANTLWITFGRSSLNYAWSLNYSHTLSRVMPQNAPKI